MRYPHPPPFSEKDCNLGGVTSQGQLSVSADLGPGVESPDCSPILLALLW